MKKIFFTLLILFSTFAPVCAQHSDKEYKQFFDENREIYISHGFEAYSRLTFKDDGTFTIDGFDSHFCDGTYSFQKNKIIINYPFNYVDKIYTKTDEERANSFNEFGMNSDKPTEYIIDLDISNIYNQGAYISKDKIFWSNRPSAPYKKYEFNGIPCIKYPIKIRINENLKIRKTPSLKGELVHIDYFNYGKRQYIEDRTVVFKGEEYKVLAKTVTDDTIDGITAPWYLIMVEGPAWPDAQTEMVWIFGGYVSILE